jgi:hypothetical protein
VTSVDSTGGARWEAVKALALLLSERRTTEVSLSDVPALAPYLSEFLDGGMLVQRAGAVRFFHETIYDHVLARAFVEDGRSLIHDVLSRPQDLSARPLIRRILTFERGIDRARYRTSVRALVENEAVRFYLRDVAFDVMREDADPSGEDWEILEPMVLDATSESHHAAWNVAIQPAWLNVIDGSGALLRWMTSPYDVDLNRATSLLRHLQRSAPGRAAILMWPFLDFGPEWHGRIRWVLTGAAPEEDRRLLDFLVASVHAGVFDQHNDETLWYASHDLPSKQPRWAVELLAAYLDRALARSPEANPFGSVLPDRSYHAEQFARTLSRHAPASFVRAALPFVIKVVEATADTERAIAQGDPWSYRYSTPGHGFDDALYEAVDQGLRTVAAKQPKAFSRLAPTLVEHTNFSSLRFLLYRAWAANPAEFWRPAVRHLLDTREPFDCGYADSPYWVTRDLIQAIQRPAPRESLTEIEQRVIDFYPEWERTPEGRASRGASQLTLLDAFSDRNLTEAGLRRREELRRKFGSSETAAPRGIQTGFVGSPIADDKARKMTDRSWLRAIRRYDTAERPGADFLKGGSVELSRVLEQQVKVEPERFAKLALRFPEDVDENYADAVLRGLADADNRVPVELLASVLRRFFAMPGRPGGRWITRPLAQIANEDIPTDVLDIAAWFATEADDPTQDSWRKTPDNDVEYYGGDPFTAGINSVRGAAAEALSVLIWPDAERLAYLTPALERLVRDPVIAVRACAAVTLRTAYRHDPGQAVELFVSLCDTDEALLGTRPVEDFLSVATKSHIEQLRPILSRMLSSDVSDVQAAAGRQAALAALADKNAYDLVEVALSGPTSARVGVAQVAAHNVVNVEVGETCARWLPAFFDDPEKTVRDEASNWVRQLGPTGIRDRHELLTQYIGSAAYHDDEAGLMHALDDSTVAVAEIALPALQEFVEHRRREMGDIQQGAAFTALLASKLAVRAYTSAASEQTRDSALDVIDALLAAKVSEIRTFVESFD